MVEANDFSDILGMLLTSFCVLLKQNNFLIIHYHEGDEEAEKDDSLVDISIHCFGDDVAEMDGDPLAGTQEIGKIEPPLRSDPWSQCFEIKKTPLHWAFEPQVRYYAKETDELFS